MKRIEQFDYGKKPRVEEIGPYLRDRMLYTDQKSAFPSITMDSLGNTVVVSSKAVEQSFHGAIPATVTVSPEGRALLRHNRPLRHLLGNPDPTWPFVGEGDEGKVYQVDLSTDSGRQAYVVKYHFPVYDERGGIDNGKIFTPGIDHMRVMQLAERDNPVPGLSYAVPVLATIDVSVSPYIAESTTLKKINASHPELAATQQGMLQKIFPNNTLGYLNTPFMQRYFADLHSIGERLHDWFTNIPTSYHSLFNAQLSFDRQSLTTGNMLIHVPEFYELYRQCQNLTDDEFYTGVAQTLTVVELVAGKAD